MESIDKPIVTITGISGYVGAQTCLRFLQSGEFKIRGTVRSTKNPKKIEPLRKAFGEYFDQLELVEADLLNENSLMQACSGSTYIVHTASPFPIENPRHEDELIKPAVEGTLAIMKAAKANKVKRVVITSSVAAIMVLRDENKTKFSVEDWSDTTIAQPYEKSKTLAEKAAWDFIENLPNEEKFEVVTINPALVLGPNLNEAQFSSGDIIKKFMMREMPGLPYVSMPLVDVRDVAEAHFRALKVPEAAGQRFILCCNSVWFADIGKWLHEKYSPDYNVPTTQLPKCLVWFLKFFRNDLALIYKMWGKQMNMDNSSTQKVLGINFIDPQKSTLDMAEALIQTGYIEDRRRNKV